jgi:hypothetical protein
MAALRLTRLTRWLWILFAANAIGITALLHFAAETPLNQTAIAQTAALVGGRQGNDSWRFMEAAVAYAKTRTPASATIYDELFFNRHLKLLYPPTALLFLDVLNGSPHVGLSTTTTLNALSIAAILITALLTAAIFRRLGPLHARANESSRLDAIAQSVAVVSLSLTFYPVVKGYGLGQIQVLLNALFSFAIWCWIVERRGAAGAAVGLMALVKPHYAALLAWTAVRRQWRATTIGVAVMIVAIACSVAVFGWRDHAAYLRVLLFASHRPEAYYPNQSIGGAVERWLGDADSAHWSDRDYPPFHPTVYCVTTAFSIAIVLMALLGPSRRARSGNVLDFGLFALAMTIGSPVAWEHHYGVMLPVFATALCVALDFEAGRGRLMWLAASYVLSANFFPFTNEFAGTPLRILQSLLLAGALLLFGFICLIGAGRKETVRAARTRHDPVVPAVSP